MKLSEAIRSAREAAELSQAEVAAKMDVSTSTVADWELGNHRPKINKLERLAAVIRTTKSKLQKAFLEAA